MNPDIPTPRTDAQEVKIKDGGTTYFVVDSALSRRLERELHIAEEALKTADGFLKPGGTWEELGNPMAKDTVQEALRRIEEMRKQKE